MARKGVTRNYYFVQHIRSGRNYIMSAKKFVSNALSDDICFDLGKFSTGHPPRLEKNQIVHGDRKHKVVLWTIEEIITADKFKKKLDESNSPSSGFNIPLIEQQIMRIKARQTGATNQFNSQLKIK